MTHLHRFSSYSRNGLFISLTVFLTILFLSCNPACTAETATELPWNVVADHFTYNKKNNTCLATGNVIVTHDQETITADSIEFNNETKKAVAEGNVVVTSKGDRSSGKKMNLDMKAKTGVIYNGTVFIDSTHMYITGNEIRKTGESTYTGDKVTITTCDGDNPDWKFTGRNLTVTIEGYGSVYHAAFWAKSVPVLYTPYLIFPVKKKRQTGLLFPEFELSDRKGYEYVQPFFWAINDSSDATVFNRAMSKRGDMAGVEYRYILSNESKGSVSYDFLKDRQIDTGTADPTGDSTKSWGYDDGIDGRTNTKRYWFRMKQNQSLFGGSTLKIDADVVSDQDYLREFDSLGNGYDYTNANFMEQFGRGLDPKEGTVRTNSLIFSKNWTSCSLNAATYWNDDVVARTKGTANTTLQKLPQIDFSVSRHQILSSPLYYDFSSQYDYFFREETTVNITNPLTELRRGQRADLYPRLILPMHFRNLFTLETSAGLRNTNWYVENASVTDDPLTGSHARNIYDLTADLSTDVFRIFNMNIGGVDKIKHTFTPELIYRYIPDQDQSNLPYFDGIDRIVRTNTVTLSLKNTLTSRSPLKTTGDGNPLKYDYNQFCRFKIDQTFDINEANETDPTRYINGTTKEPFRPLYSEIELIPSGYLSLKGDGSWSHYNRVITKGNLGLTLSDKRKDKLSVEYRYTREGIDTTMPTSSIITPVKYIRSYLYLTLTDRIALFGLNERNLQQDNGVQVDKELKTSAGIIFNTQCWGIEVDYTHTPGDTRYTLGFSLKGLGEFGSNNNPNKL